jgi:hypothetical protein
MDFRKELTKRIKKKESENLDIETQITNLQNQLDRNKSYLQGLYDSLGLLPKDEEETGKSEVQLRANSDLAKSRDALRLAGHPLHIKELLTAIDKPITQSSKVSLSGSISFYVRKKQIFTRPAPNTFGLREFSIPALKIEEESESPSTEGDEIEMGIAS